MQMTVGDMSFPISTSISRSLKTGWGNKIKIMVRAKFKVDSVEPNGDGSSIKLSAVVGGSNSEENDEFFNATPFGVIDMGIVNAKASEQFEVGKEFYVDFTLAE